MDSTPPALLGLRALIQFVFVVGSLFKHLSQWHNEQGAECPPETSDREIFADVSGKMRQGKKGKRGEN